MRTILFEKKDQVGIIRLNRPDKYNSFNREMALALQDCLDHAREDEEVRALLLTGSGKAFCAGQDLQEVIDNQFENMSQILLEQLNPIVLRIREMDKPVVCAVNGVAAGAGANIALACDLTLAGESAAFIQAFSKIGLIPDTGGTFTLPRLVGRQKAMALMMLGDKVPAVEAEKMGMIYQAVDDDKLGEQAFQLARQLASLPTIALGLTKRALNQSEKNDFQEQLDLEEQMQSQAGLTEDFKEGVNAFIEKRQPKYQGK